MNEALESKLEKRVVRRFKRYPQYKDSGVEWLGGIPAHWDIRRLKYLASVNDEILPEDTPPDRELQYVDISSVDTVHGITSKEELLFGAAPSRARRIVRHGDVIVSTVRTYLRAIASITDPEPNLIVSTGFAVIRPMSQLDTAFASYALQAPYFVERVVANSVGVSYPAINATEIACFSLAVPPVTEQQAIAAFLTRETAKIDALVARKERMIERLQEKRTALITQTVTKGLDPNVPMRNSGVEWLGQIPVHWTTVRLMFKTAFGHPIMYGIVLPGPHYEGGVPIVKGGDVAPDRLRRELLRCTDPGIEAAYVRSRLREDDLVYAIRGSIGAVELVPGDVAGSNVTQDVAKIAPHPSVSPRWLLYVMKSTALFSQLEAGALGATIRGINIRDLKRCRIPLPPLDEQDRIASVLDQQMATGDALVTRIRDGIERLKEYRTALISAAATGKIDVRDSFSDGTNVPAVME